MLEGDGYCTGILLKAEWMALFFGCFLSMHRRVTKHMVGVVMCFLYLMVTKRYGSGSKPGAQNTGRLTIVW